MPQKRNIQASETSAQAVGRSSPKRYSIWQNDSRKIWLAAALFITGLVLTGAAVLYEKKGAEFIAGKEFDFACNEIKSRIATRIEQHAQILRSGSAFFEINENITRQQWHNFITRQNIELVLPGIQGIGYAIIIPPDQLALHERKIRNEGFPQYAVKPAGKREIYTSIIYIEPFSERNLRAFGYDMFSEPIRRKAMEHARDFDEATLSGKIMLVQETDKEIQSGTLMYVPVYKRGLPVKTIEERRRAIRGWVYSPYRMNDLMRGILGAWGLGEERQIRLEVFDNTSFHPEALLYDSVPGQKLELTSGKMLSEQTSILFKNHRWSLRFTQVVNYKGIVDYSKAWYALIGGTLTSALLFALYVLLVIARHREQKAEEALKRELRESTDRKRAEEALRESEKRYRELSIVDDLTQLYNSRHFYLQLKIELDRSNRYGQPLTLLLLDLDDFKIFNDTYGHVEGDQVLRRLGQVVKRCLRETDFAFRYGGEEFTILLPMTTCGDAAVTAERIRADLKEEIFSPVQGQDVYMTVSIGLGQYKPREDMKAFVHRVDQLMYQAKKNGKDRVCSES
jgi:diguanylate cyclase (GGDEF)-like protein